MAHNSNNQHAVYGIAVALIGLCLFVHYAWMLAPPADQARLWNACGAIGRLALLCSTVWHVRSKLVLWIALWWACEELMVAGCSIAYIVKPWVIAEGEAQCSSLLQFDLDKLGVFIVLLLLTKSVNSYRCNK